MASRHGCGGPIRLDPSHGTPRVAQRGCGRAGVGSHGSGRTTGPLRGTRGVDRGTASALLERRPGGRTAGRESDHGEALGEGGRWGHGHALDEVLLEVPLPCVASRHPVSVDGPCATSSQPCRRVDGGSAPPGVGEGTRLGGVRGHPDVFGRWEQGGVAASSTAEPARAPPALLDAQHRSALERLGYLDGTEGPE